MTGSVPRCWRMPRPRPRRAGAPSGSDGIRPEERLCRNRPLPRRQEPSAKRSGEGRPDESVGLPVRAGHLANPAARAIRAATAGRRPDGNHAERARSGHGSPSSAISCSTSILKARSSGSRPRRPCRWCGSCPNAPSRAGPPMSRPTSRTLADRSISSGSARRRRRPSRPSRPCSNAMAASRSTGSWRIPPPRPRARPGCSATSSRSRGSIRNAAARCRQTSMRRWPSGPPRRCGMPTSRSCRTTARARCRTACSRPVMAAAAAADVRVVVDPKRRDLAAYRGAAIITPNRAELTLATGHPCETDADALSAARIASGMSGADVLLTRSEKGMSYFPVRGEPIHLPTVAARGVRRVGRGRHRRRRAGALPRGRPADRGRDAGRQSRGRDRRRQGRHGARLA